MLRLPTLLLLFTLAAAAARSQSIPPQAYTLLQQKEDTLKQCGDSMINAEYAGKRFLSDSLFVRCFVRALKTKNSFYYPFDSLATVSRLYAPDSSFRIFTWQLKKDDYLYYQKGAIQVHTPDGSLKLYPLFDASMFTAKPLDSVRTRKNWIGAIYYRIIKKEFNGKKYYTLLGFDDYTVSSNRKWLEVLHFDESTGEPLFGGPFVSFKNDTGKARPVQMRFDLEYKKEARAIINYNPDMDLIIYDHLISETNEPNKRDTYIPDGDFEGFKWENGQWVHVNQVFHYNGLKDGQFPQESLIKDNQGNSDEKKLMEQSEKNIEKAKQKEEAKKTPGKKN